MTKCKYRLILEHADGTEIISFFMFEFPYQKSDTVLIGKLEYVVTKRIVEPLQKTVRIVLTEPEH
jgi:hypothetical protein